MSAKNVKQESGVILGHCGNPDHDYDVDIGEVEWKGCWNCTFFELNSKYCYVEEAAKTSGVCEDTMRRWLRSEKVKAWRLVQGRTNTNVPKLRWIISRGEISQIARSGSETDRETSLKRRLNFKPEMTEKILAGIKTETRRRICRPYTMFRPGDTFAVGSEIFRITAIDRQRLGDMTEGDIRCEGLNGRSEFVDLWARFYGNHDPEEEVLVIKFEPAGEQTKAI